MIARDGQTYSLIQIKTSVKTFSFLENHHHTTLDNRNFASQNNKGSPSAESKQIDFFSKMCFAQCEQKC